jgi:hypothetical protein
MNHDPQFPFPMFAADGSDCSMTACAFPRKTVSASNAVIMIDNMRRYAAILTETAKSVFFENFNGCR